MKTISHPSRRAGFSLMETVIAIGVLALLLTAFMAVFGPATTGIRRSISAQEADRLVSAVRQELEILRAGQKDSNGQAYGTAFEKAFEWIRDSHDSDQALLVYEYRGSANEMRDGAEQDRTLVPYSGTGVPGADFVSQPMMRRLSDRDLLREDLEALDGRIYVVKMRQLVQDGTELVPGTAGQIVEGEEEVPVQDADSFPDAVLPFVAEFYAIPSTDFNYLTGGSSSSRFAEMDGERVRPLFSRNLAVRR